MRTDMPQREKTATVNLRVRMKEHLREQIEATAGHRGVSLNAEAVARLERSFREDWIIEQIRQLVAPAMAVATGSMTLNDARRVFGLDELPTGPPS
jgi:Arc-like DNA binding domain